MPTLHAETALLPDGWQDNVHVELGDDGRITAVTPNFSGPPAEAHVSCLLTPTATPFNGRWPG